MNIKQYLLKVLNNKEILDMLPDKKVYFLHANNPNKNLYLEYEILDGYGVEYSENKEDFANHLVQVDLFSTGNYADLETLVKKHMINNGFEGGYGPDLYEEKTQLKHKVMRFNIDLPTD
ncbi:TPA: prohead protease [Clostridium botulinum]|nr:prohead protease [Clostridium botulinum]